MCVHVIFKTLFCYPIRDITNYLILNDLFNFRRITTVNRWFTDNGYDVKEIWASIEVRNVLISCRSGSWLKNKVHLCTCKLTKVSMCKHGIGSYMCSKEKLLSKWYMTFERKWWASVTLLDTWHNFSLSASFICNMWCHEYKLDITREFKSPVSYLLPSLHSTLQNNFSVGNTGGWYRFP